jgi:exoribonuclease R
MRFSNIITIDNSIYDILDDAVSYEIISHNKIRVDVHVSDVTHIVKPYSDSFYDAYNKIESTYNPEVSMIPEFIAREYLSLKSDTPRLVITVSFHYLKHNDKWKRMGNSIFTKNIICVEKNMTYSQADLPENDEYMFGLKVVNEVWESQGRLQDHNTPGFEEVDGVVKIIERNELSRILVGNVMKQANIEAAKFIISKRMDKGKQYNKLLEHINPETDFYPYKLALSLSNPSRTGSARVVTGSSFNTQVDSVYTRFTSPLRRFHDLIVHYIVSSKIDNKDDIFDERCLKRFADKINNFKRPKDRLRKRYLIETESFDGVVVYPHDSNMKVFIYSLNTVVNASGKGNLGDSVKLNFNNKWISI